MADSKITAVLGPTNTGKTHLAVERMCAHSSGMMGFPLRLLAREIYDRVVKMKGAHNVALITGEERISPPHAKWLLCTTESIPMDRDVAFIAIDEVQLSSDPERGHIFTDRLLNARGREETMLLGSQSLKPVIKTLLPEAEIITRPRFSKLSFTPPKKLARLPARSAIVAFSVEEVYAIAEMLRQSRGGAAVVMGALSPRTRNAQVKMYQDGDVDYLVATDAIGMGLNMDVSSVYFASLSKFDGRRQRRLNIAEMAQIAGRAGRHQHDGQFGTLTGGDSFTPDEIDNIENHYVPTLDYLSWRCAEPDFRSISHLIQSLETVPSHPKLRAAPEANDIMILKILGSETNIIASTRTPDHVATLWDVCRLPDFQKLGPEFHAKLVGRIFGYLSSGDGYFPEHIFADQLVRLDSIQGDVPTVAARISVTRTWAYIAQRADWLANPEKWRLRTAELEEKLSDALHVKLTERFVDRRTKMLVRNASSSGDLLAVEVEADGAVFVEDQQIGRLDGFHFSTDPLASLVDRKRLITAAEKHLARELISRAKALISADEQEIVLKTETGMPIRLSWNGISIGMLKRGKSLLTPKIMLDPSIMKLDPSYETAIMTRLDTWLSKRLAAQLPTLFIMKKYSENPQSSPSMRAFLAQLVDASGVIDRNHVEDIIAIFDAPARHILKRMGIVIGALDVFHPKLIKPEAARWRVALAVARTNEAMPPLPMPGMGLLDQPTAALIKAAKISGYRSFGTQMLRIDLVEKITKKIHDQRSGKLPFTPEHQLTTALGISDSTLSDIMKTLGFTPVEIDNVMQWRWRGIRRHHTVVTNHDHSAFSALGSWQNNARQ